jgi:fatty acid desaturase
VNEKQQWNRQVRRTALLTVALAAAWVFGIVVLASGDWIPGTIIVAATLLGLSREAPVIRKLCSTPAPEPTRGKPTR